MAKEEDGPNTDILKVQKRIKKEFKYLSEVPTQDLQAEFVLAQAKEICSYLSRLSFTPFKAWEASVTKNIVEDEKVFLYDFYLIRNEFEQIEPDLERIESLRLLPPPEDD